MAERKVYTEEQKAEILKKAEETMFRLLPKNSASAGPRLSNGVTVQR